MKRFRGLRVLGPVFAATAMFAAASASAQLKPMAQTNSPSPVKPVALDRSRVAPEAKQASETVVDEPLPYSANVDDPAMIRGMITFSACVVIRDFKAVGHLLNSGNFNEPENAEIRDIVARNEVCSRGSPMKFNQVIFAGDIAETMYRAMGFSFETYGPDLKRTRPLTGGACVAAERPREVDALLSSFPTSPEEKAALLSVMSVADRCFPSISHHAAVLRGAIMAGAYPTVAKIAGTH